MTFEHSHSPAMKTFNGASLVIRAKSLSLPPFRVAALAFVVSVLPLKAATLYVNSSQTNNPSDGLSWNSAFKTVNQALALATNGTDVWIARGVYPERLVLSNGVALYGGFVGSESDLAQRNWKTNQTVLDGGQLGTVITVTTGSSNTTRIDGLVIRNGKASAGGGIFFGSASPTIINNQILWNTSTNGGGGIFFFFGSPLIASNLIQGNIGGAIRALDSSPQIINNRIIANFDAIYTFSAEGIFCSGNGAAEIIGNVVSAHESGIVVSNPNAARIINNTIIWNSTQAMTCNSNCIVANNIIAMNRDGINGVPGIVLSNNCFWSNMVAFIGIADPIGTNGNISADPLWIENAFTPEFHLGSNSPCIDTGSTTFVVAESLDVDGDARITGSSVDIGADEFSAVEPIYAPTIVRVKPSGNDGNDGDTWSLAKRTVQSAIDAASLNGGEVWVAAGSYTNNLTLRHFVRLYGGFNGTETGLDERDWNTNVTILDGGQTGSVISVIDLDRWAGPIDGFVIRNGFARFGAGIYCNDSSLEIFHNVITNNIVEIPSLYTMGGGIYLFFSSAVVVSNVVSFNRASFGGGIGCDAQRFGQQMVVQQNRFERNLATSANTGAGAALANGGAGVYFSGREAALIEGNVFVRNVATNQSTSRSCQGGAICIGSSISAAVIVNNTLLHNLAINNSNALNLENGGGIYSASPSVIANNIVAFGSSGIYSAGFAGNSIHTNIINNCVFGNGTNYLRMPDLTGTNRNFSADPGLINMSDFRLSSNSPCINSGDTNYVTALTDFGGNPRVVGSTVDVGAYEFQFPESVISYAWLQQYGLPTDGSIDFSDGDNDQADTWAEWKALTDPTDDSSVLRMLSAVPVSGGAAVSWQSVPGQRYCLERATDPASFSVIQPNIIGMSSLTTTTDATATNSTAYYYRVGVGE